MIDREDKVLIEVKNLTKYYGGMKALDNISFTVNKGEIFAMLGPSGCGKTTTLRALAGFEIPDEGRIMVGEKAIAGEGVYVQPEDRNIGMVFQDYALFPHLTVEGNILFGLKKFPQKQKRGIVNNMLNFVGLEGFSKRYPNQLSGGQQQRVALARALAPCPVVLLLDEPLSNLDSDMRTKMREDVLTMLRKARTTAIIVTHDQQEAFSMADRVAVLNEGRIEQIGTPEEIYHFPHSRFVAEFVGEADFIDGIVKGKEVETEIGVFNMKSKIEEGLHVKVMIRPDDILFVADDRGNAKVVQRQFKGEENLYHLKLPSGFVLHSSMPSTFLVDIGSTVTIHANPDHVVLFDNDVARSGGN